MKESTVLNIGLAVISVCVTTLVVELGLRIYHGKVFHWESLTAELPNRGRMVYDPRLGWLPRAGKISGRWVSNTDASGLRSNGRSITTAGRPILAVGDSFTFGDEVQDSETWPAHLEELLNKRVLNAGVSAYGIDQAFLRAELLLDRYDPDVVILSFISDDINRTEFSNYPYAYGRGWKPYFELIEGSLSLQNVPVPRKPAARCCQGLRRALGYSFLANAVLGRTTPRWWKNLPIIERVHSHGENVSVELFARLDNLMKDRRGHFIAIALATSGRIGNNARLSNVINRAREKGVEILDLSTELQKLDSSQFQNLFLPGGHYSPATNKWMAKRIAAYLQRRGIRSPSERSRIAR